MLADFLSRTALMFSEPIATIIAMAALLAASLVLIALIRKG
jgi:hypothetical protein